MKSSVQHAYFVRAETDIVPAFDGNTGAPHRASLGARARCVSRNLLK